MGVLALGLVAYAAYGLYGGVRLGGDSPRFIGGAEALLTGEAWPSYASHYLGYVVLLAAAEAVGLGLPGAVGFQLALALVAAAALFDLGRRLRGDWAGIVAAVLFLGHLELLRWHLYIYTESVFTSLLVIAVWMVHRAAERSGWWYAPAALAVLAVASVRPNGWLFVPVVGVYWIHRGLGRSVSRWAATVGLLVVFLVFVAAAPVFRSGVEHAEPATALRTGVVVWGYEEGDVDMPATEQAGEGPVAMIRYAVEHPVATATLVVRRVGTSLAQVRPYYSPRHNAYVALTAVVIYGLAALGLAKVWRRPLTWLLLGVVVVQLGFVGATFANWEGRFLVPVLPFLMVLSGAGAVRVARLVGTHGGLPRSRPSGGEDVLSDGGGAAAG